MNPIFVVSCALAALSAITVSASAKVGPKSTARSPAFTNIISNYFTTDPFFKAKQKARLHLPSKRRLPVTSNAKQDRMSSPSPALRMKLGPPIQILPSLSAGEIHPPQTIRLHQTNQKKVKTKRDSLLVVGAKKDGEVVVPAPLLAASDNNKAFENNYDDMVDNRDTRNRRQSFSQLISSSYEDKKQKQKFKNFPVHESQPVGPQFKLSPDMPFSFPSDGRVEKNQPPAPTVTFKNAEDLRYQNDYYELPEPDDFQLQNEIFQNFESPKIKPGKSEYAYYEKPKKQIKYSEGLKYLNPLDKYHKATDVEIFEVASSPFTREDASYSNYKSNSHFVDLGGRGPSVNQYHGDSPPTRSQALYKPARKEERQREEAEEMYFQNRIENKFRDLPDNFYDIPKMSGENFDEHVFSLPDGGNVEQDSPDRGYDSYGPTYKREISDFKHYNDIDYKDYDDYEYKDHRGYDKSDYDKSEYDKSEYDRPDYDRPDYRQAEYAIPDPLPPPPAILEMQHDSVFAGNFDVPKLGVATDYKPPEVVYNEMFQKAGNSFSNLLPQQSPAKLSRSLHYSATPSPFLPTPSKPRKPLPDYSHLYQSKNQARREKTKIKIPPFVSTSSPYKQYEDKKRNFFKPRSSPSLTFEAEPEYTNEVFDEDRDLYERLHGGSGVEESDYEEYGGSISREDFPLRAERVLAPQTSSYQRTEMTATEEEAPRYKRYPSVDYSPQRHQSFDQFFRKPVEPYSPEPFIPYSEPTPAYPTPTPYHHHQPPTPEPEYFSHQTAELPAPDNFLDSPQLKTPDYFSSDYYGSDYNYNSPSYKSYELDTYEPNYHDSFANIDIPKLQPGGGGSLWNNELGTGGGGNYNQFVNVAGPEAFEHGHGRGNPEHMKQEYSRREGRHFKSQVTWSDGDEGYGKHYFEFNH